MTAPLPMPTIRKRPSLYLTRQQVIRLCRSHGIGEHTARDMFFTPDSPARKVLPGRTYAVYVRAVVVSGLGLSEETQP